MVREVKVGLLGILGIVILYFGFTYLKGSEIFSTSNTYKATFKDVLGLEVSNPVTFNGVNVGRVTNLYPQFDKSEVIVELTIDEDVKLTDNSFAILADDGLIGGKLIKLKIAPGKLLEEDGNLKSMLEVGLVDVMQQKIDPTLKNVDSLTRTLTRIINEFDHTGQALKILLASATQSSDGVNTLVANNSKNIGLVTANAATLTKNLNALALNLDEQIKPILTKTGSFSDSLSALQLGTTINNLNGTVKNLQTMLNQVNAGKGTLGKLAGDDSLYTNLDRTAASLNLLLSDMKVNPKRYVHFSLFGKKDKTKK
ncbi:MAG: MCE family protein [Cytophagaceae bacterium]|nr:MCE family protein [Cytophagaceae bacterium]MBK9933523.1 MCE family protein [Cytophagaceae bacterium]MBL0302763.1 MCE family protein [Cytophagaceae bacterium]MBL0325584.1 MCE family protein [Cytophagaceae bacterium]